METLFRKLNIDSKKAMPIVLAIGIAILLWLLLRRRSAPPVIATVEETPAAAPHAAPYANRAPPAGYTVLVTRPQTTQCDCSRERGCGCTGGNVLSPTHDKLVEDLGLLLQENVVKYYNEILSAVPSWMIVNVKNPLEGMQNYGSN